MKAHQKMKIISNRFRSYKKSRADHKKFVDTYGTPWKQPIHWYIGDLAMSRAEFGKEPLPKPLRIIAGLWWGFTTECFRWLTPIKELLCVLLGHRWEETLGDPESGQTELACNRCGWTHVFYMH